MDERTKLRQRVRAYLWSSHDLLNDERFEKLPHPLAGACYVASEVYFHLTDGYDEWYVTRAPVTITDPETGEPWEVTHWWLENRQTGEVVDLTAEQFGDDVDMDEVYARGTHTGFLTSEPSERAQRVLDAVRPKQRASGVPGWDR